MYTLGYCRTDITYQNKTGVRIAEEFRLRYTYLSNRWIMYCFRQLLKKLVRG